jgi:hypothetical protein
MMKQKIILSILMVMLFAGRIFAADGLQAADDHAPKVDKASELAKQSQDPLSGLILMPVEYSYTPRVGPLDKPAQQVIFEPTFPIKINDEWQILTHTLIPFVKLPEIGEDTTSSGLSNITTSALLTSKKSAKYTWGVGGGLMFPTASNTAPLSWTNTPTGYDCWAAGPAVVGVYKDGPWVAGALVNQMWSFGGGTASMNMMQIQGFGFFNWGDGYYLGSMPRIMIDWTKSADQGTLLPLGLQIGKLFMIGGVFPLGLSVGGYYNVIRPDFAPESTLRVEMFFILPEFW